MTSVDPSPEGFLVGVLRVTSTVHATARLARCCVVLASSPKNSTKTAPMKPKAFLFLDSKSQLVPGLRPIIINIQMLMAGARSHAPLLGSDRLTAVDRGWESWCLVLGGRPGRRWTR